MPQPVAPVARVSARDAVPSAGVLRPNQMTDYFALLDEPRRPWIDASLLKERFLALSSRVHPDRVHQASAGERKDADERYAGLNAAYNCLREPKDRLRHLLELELGKKPGDIQNIPPELMDGAFKIARTCKSADTLLAEKTKVTSAILKVQFFERGQECVDALNALQRAINEQRAALLAELETMNPAWESPNGERPLKRLEEIYRLLGYFVRWSEQLQERIVQLSF
jgi:curved DNA-binding protein CbpA